MIRLHELVLYLDTYLDTPSFKDDSWNGLQVEGKSEVSRVLFAVDAGIMTFERAVLEGFDMVVVHHGMFWRASNPSFTSWNKKRLDMLINNGISLYASHLPLDRHPEVGNNAQLLKILGFEKESDFGWYGGQPISYTGRSDTPKNIWDIEQFLNDTIGSRCKVLPFGKEEIYTTAICSGGGASYALFSEAVNLGVDLYITGDSTEMYQLAKDIGINVIFAGHHATETVGVKALSELVGEKFEVEATFIDIPTGL